jgi:hypothetical protein
MDSRIREIEQWVAEAREGLSDGGREVYLRKLYLLEAEIRAVIKENGMLPQGTSPVPAEKRVRRSVSHARAFNMSAAAAGVLVLAATTFYFVNAGSARPTSDLTVQPRLALAGGQQATETNPPTRNRLAAVMAGMGEELLPDSWTPATESSLLVANSKVNDKTAPAGAQAARKPAPAVVLASRPAVAASPARPEAKPALKNKAGGKAGAQEATDVVILASAAAADTAPAGKAPSKIATGSGSRPTSGFNDRAILSYQFFPEGMAPPVKPIRNTTKTKMNSLAHGSSHETHDKAEVLVDNDSGDNVDDSGDKAAPGEETGAAGDGADEEGSQSDEKSGTSS